VPAQTQSALTPQKRLVFGLVIAFLYMRFSLVHEFISTKLGLNLYWLLVVGIAAIFGLVMCGAIPHTLKSRASWYWLAYFLWIIMAIPFSVWRGDSFRLAMTYGRTEICVLFMLAGLPLVWSDCRKLINAISFGAFCCLIVSSLMMVTNYGGERLSLAGGSMSNSNDFAAHLLFVTPFLLFPILSTRAKFGYRAAASVALAYSLVLILYTASRGALIAIGVVSIYTFWRSSARIRIAMLISLPVILAGAIVVLPASVFERLLTFSTTGNNAVSAEAADSARLRQYEFDTSVRYTMENPLFGVGPGQFANYEGKNTNALGSHGFWTETHSVITQVSSECGIPALLFFLAGIGSTWILTHKVQKIARENNLREIWLASLCLGISLVGFVTAAVFLNLAYRFYFPALTGLAIALLGAARQQVQAMQAVPVAAVDDSYGPAPGLPSIHGARTASPAHSASSRPAPSSAAGARVPKTPVISSKRFRFGRVR
jgi:hypothetical protein